MIFFSTWLCVVACAFTAAHALSLVKNTALVEDGVDEPSYLKFGFGFCSPDEKEDGSRIGEWVLGQNKKDAEKACETEEMCKGFHWNKGDKSYILVGKVGPELGEDTEKGEVCYQRPEPAESAAQDADENSDDNVALPVEPGLAAEILKSTTGKTDWRFEARIKDLAATHSKLPSIEIGGKNCIGNDGAHALQELSQLKSLTFGGDNGISSKVFSGMTKLTSLTIGNTNGFDSGVYMALSKLTDLTSLSIGGKNQFGLDAICESSWWKPKDSNATELFAKPRDFIKEEYKAFAMAKALAKVQSIFLGEANCIGVEGAKAFGNLRRLESLSIGSKNNIGVAGAVALGTLTKLTAISIGNGNGFGSKGFKALKSLTKLTSLTIGDKNSFGVDHHEDVEKKHEDFQAQCHKAHQEGED